MAEASLLPIAESLLGKLGPCALDKIKLCWGSRDDLQRLVSSIKIIKAGLLDAERRQESRDQEGGLVREWIRRLRNVLYDADDLFDKVFTIEDSKQKLTGKEKSIEELRQFFSKCNQVILRVEIAYKIKKIRQELDDIKTDMANFAFDRSLLENSLYYERETGSVKAADDIIGREEDEGILMGLLMDVTSKEEGSADVIAIVGFGGLGKTTLAQLLFNNKAIEKNFELHAWACISDIKGTTTKARIIFDALQTTETIGSSERSSNPRNVDKVSVNIVEREIQAKVRNKKYFLVLDDFWDEDRKTWLYLKGLLRGGKMGSKILVTTRSSDVALAMGIEFPYNIKVLADDKAWELFKTLAFRSGADAVDQELDNMGKQIVRKCRNIPLAIKAIASLLYVCRDKKKTWTEVVKSDMITLERHHNLNILPVLKLSYYHLPSHLKHCFVFCSVFPKDFEMEGQKLIFYWIAQGYVERESDGGQYGLMQIGKTYLKELVSRSFLQDTGYGFYYKMHDLMHDLAQEVAGKELQRVESSKNWLDAAERIGETKRINHVFEDVRIRHLSLFGTRNDYDFLPLKRAKHLRSLISLSKVSRMDFRVLSYLRLLDLSDTGIENLCCSIGELEHLRCLIISRNEFTQLPDEICKLHNLKIFDVSWCKKLKTLPRISNKLINNLTCLRVVKCDSLRGMPCKSGALSSLESLDSFIIGESSSEYSGLESLAGLVNLRDEGLFVQFNKRSGGAVRKEDDQKRVDMSSSLVHLDRLTLVWPSNDDEGIVRRIEEVDGDGDDGGSEWGREGVEFQCSQLPPNLKALHIYNFLGWTLPVWNAFNNLLSVYLRDCKNCRYLPSFDKQPRIKILLVRNFENLEYIQMEENGEFPCLEKLMLVHLPKLKAWSPGMEKLAHQHISSSPPDAISAIPQFHSLTRLNIQDCPELMLMPLPLKGECVCKWGALKEPLKTLLEENGQMRARDDSSC